MFLQITWDICRYLMNCQRAASYSVFLTHPVYDEVITGGRDHIFGPQFYSLGGQATVQILRRSINKRTT